MYHRIPCVILHELRFKLTSNFMVNIHWKPPAELTHELLVVVDVCEDIETKIHQEKEVRNVSDRCKFRIRICFIRTQEVLSHIEANEEEEEGSGCPLRVGALNLHTACALIFTIHNPHC